MAKAHFNWASIRKKIYFVVYHLNQASSFKSIDALAGSIEENTQNITCVLLGVQFSINHDVTSPVCPQIRTIVAGLTKEYSSFVFIWKSISVCLSEVCSINSQGGRGNFTYLLEGQIHFALTVKIQKVSHFRFSTLLWFTVLCSVFQ